MSALELSTVLRSYSRLGTLQSLPSLQTGGFSGARVWKVRLGETFYCLRRWPPEGINVSRLEALHALLEGIVHRGVTEIPRPLRTSNGATFVEFHGTLWHLETWKPGRADFSKCRSEARLSHAMQTLARWHRAARDICPTLPESRPFFQSSHSAAPAVVNRLKLLQDWTEPRLSNLARALCVAPRTAFRDVASTMSRLFERALPEARIQMAWAQDLQVPLQPCLRDVWHDHVLFTGDVVTGLIDCSAARTDTVAADLSRLLGSFVENDAAAWAFALSEYAKHNPLTPEEMQLVPILDRSGLLLSGMTWLDRHLLRGLPLDQPEAVTARLQQIVARLGSS